ncbi:MAG: phenylacetate--CoA ligase [Comamonadaceae bacterium]|jgi:phenylacetate-CoA ligase|uniref:phenylacetate--CoA ligase family protein n=1 Tax=Hydrogenophaga sp. SNF1 TaxID=3098762 RepID=UPI002ACBF38A|nr:AMP-binding protein [Hydrogenophaga sp. SNF1]NCT99823.1 phenylacetate--CoA ligase [Comamonadaceae bacterium]WQB82953.1 AMP-binding protein [Hydrogenophaga sp. SNF1]
MNPFFDALETRAPAQREAEQMAALARQVAHAQAHSPAFAEILSGVDASGVNSRAALAKLPVTRKSSLLARQRAQVARDAFGGFSTLVRGPAMTRLYASPGPIYEPEGATRDYWRTGRALFAAGFRAGELVHNAFSYHMTPGAFILESGAHAVGCTVFPAGTGQTEQQLQAMAELRPEGYTGTPSFLRILIEKAAETGADLSSLTKAVVGGEACPPSLTAWFAERGVAVYQTYATADLGLVAYETAAREGLVLEEHVIVEIVRPGTDDPVAEGEVGELVVTTLNPAYPLIRFGTGDLSAMLPGACPTGRTAPRIKGWMGRADQTTKVRGMFVHPSQVADIARRFPQIRKARLVVSGEMASDQLCLRVEAEPGGQATEALRESIAAAVRDITKLRGEVELVAPGSLPNDGKVIEDARSYR